MIDQDGNRLDHQYFLHEWESASRQVEALQVLSVELDVVSAAKPCKACPQSIECHITMPRPLQAEYVLAFGKLLEGLSLTVIPMDGSAPLTKQCP